MTAFAKYFSLEEARDLLPQLNEMLENTDAELYQLWVELKEANKAYEKAEEAMNMSSRDNPNDLRERRKDFEEAVAILTTAQQIYLDCLNKWLEKYAEVGVVLRDVREGLLDFPACKGNLIYFYCWRKGESDINFWHLHNDGFSGRKPLITLDEYF